MNVTPKDLVLDILLDADDCDVIDIYNMSLGEREVFPMSEFDEELKEKKPSEIAHMIEFGEFDSDDLWFKFDEYKNLESTSQPLLDWIVIEELAEYMLDTHDAYGYPALEELFEKLFPDDWF